jgi:hypothetical protein
VALRALLSRVALGLVDAMAIEAAVQACVPCLLGEVTARAGLRIERRRSVRMVAVAARLIRVGADRMLAALRAIVTTHARPLGTSGERMAVLTVRRVDAGMQRRQLAGVAALADLGRRRRESGVAVARLARDLADVRDVTGTGRDGAIRRRHLLGHAIVPRSAASDREHDQEEHARHGRDPIG